MDGWMNRTGPPGVRASDYLYIQTYSSTCVHIRIHIHCDQSMRDVRVYIISCNIEIISYACKERKRYAW
jgi:hypothetical protein